MEALLQKEYKEQIIVEQQIIGKKLYIITKDKYNGEYNLWLENKKLGKARNPIELYQKI
jgi:hypothetical protein